MLHTFDIVDDEPFVCFFSISWFGFCIFRFQCGTCGFSNGGFSHFLNQSVSGYVSVRVKVSVFVIGRGEVDEECCLCVCFLLWLWISSFVWKKHLPWWLVPECWSETMHANHFVLNQRMTYVVWMRPLIAIHHRPKWIVRVVRCLCVPWLMDGFWMRVCVCVFFCFL